MIQNLPIDKFIALRDRYPIVDVRTPAEYEKGHIPGAVNLPLFSNEERAEIGITYKHTGRQEAILRGLDFVGPKMRSMIEQARRIGQEDTLLVHCWRGGMRSDSVARLLNFYGYQIYTLTGGYKSFRRYVLTSFEESGPMIILGGKTGSGKTDILKAIAAQGHSVIDLEGIAHHKGSVFGALGQSKQPSQQHFENQLALLWRDVLTHQPVWLEDESRYIGSVRLPDQFHHHMRQAQVVFIEVPFEARLARLVAEYGQYPIASATEALLKIRKRLGGLHTTQAMTALNRGDLETCCIILLKHYYDKTYLYGLSCRPPGQVQHIKLLSSDPNENAKQILQAIEG